MSGLQQFINRNFFTNAYLMDMKQINACAIFNSLPFQIEGGKVAVRKTYFSRCIVNINMIFGTIMALIYSVRMIHTATNKEAKLQIFEILLYVGWSTLLACVLAFKLEYFNKSHETVSFLNGLHTLEKKQIAQGVNTIYKGWNEDFLWPILSFLSFVTIIGLPTYTAILALLKPCLGIFAGSMFLPCLDNELTDSAAYTYVVFFVLLEWYNIAQGIGAGTLANVPGNFYVMITIRNFLDAILKKNIYTFDKVRKMEYRRFQLYVNMANVCMAPVLYPVMISSWSILIVVGVYAGVNLFDRIPFPLYAVFVLLGVDGILIVNFVLKECGKINKTSSKILRKFGILVSEIRNERGVKLNARKDLKSLPPMRIRIGDSNYFEMSTPLQILFLCLNNIVNLMLAS